ncbi:hypothetical protein ISF_01177 [Cordyceps fumosorosea ARSEF 2679]|uniref:Extracellular membrane protein, CFEM domain protein n=1 Tax=Cordyceps fumosorosea (strain ARSEF 2679) TaxID=1081104 RepID=A0A162LKX7_CORFA|nr:hypothetical protein ISF_01177 [Cordyceps fumosorosea ARSEF 2679]OAA72104.1 hypothetical protein ISF_01177 [Cordyceps fumosorosea ARSEF 2679]
MRFSTLSAVIMANAMGALAIESLSESVKDFPQCSYSAFKNALSKEGCDVKNIGAGTFDCLCKHLQSIVVTMVTSKLDANCQANWSQALTGVCAQWELASTTATDFPEATKALASELGAAGAVATSTGSAASSGSTAGAASTSSSKGPAAAATPVMGLLGAAALAGMLV